MNAAEYFKVVDITPPGEPIHHELDLAADSEAALAISPAVQKGLTNLVAESGVLFGARHYRDYHFLLTLSDHVAHFGLEHHESNDSRLPERVLIAPGAAFMVGSSAAARVCALVERQVPAPGGPDDAGLREADGDGHAVGL